MIVTDPMNNAWHQPNMTLHQRLAKCGTVTRSTCPNDTRSIRSLQATSRQLTYLEWLTAVSRMNQKTIPGTNLPGLSYETKYSNVKGR